MKMEFDDKKKLGKYLKNKTIGETHYEQEDSHLIMMEYYKGQRLILRFINF